MFLQFVGQGTHGDLDTELLKACGNAEDLEAKAWTLFLLSLVEHYGRPKVRRWLDSIQKELLVGVNPVALALLAGLERLPQAEVEALSFHIHTAMNRPTASVRMIMSARRRREAFYDQPRP